MSARRPIIVASAILIVVLVIVGAITNAQTSQANPQVILNLQNGQQYFGVPHVYQGDNDGQPTSSWPLYYGPSTASQYWSQGNINSNQPVLDMVPSSSCPSSGAMFWQSYYSGGSVTITLVGTFSSGSSPYADGFEIYLFLQPTMWSIGALYNYSISYISTAKKGLSHWTPELSRPSSVEGDVILPQSSTPYIVVQWDPFWQTGWTQGGATGQWNVWIVSNPYGNDYSVNPSPSPNLGSPYAGWDGIGTGYFQPRPDDRISITVTYDPSTNTLSGVATDQATEQSASFTLSLNGYFTPPNSGSYIFGVAGTCGRGTNWALLYVATQGLYASTITSTTSTAVQTTTTSTVTATSTVTSTVTATSTVTSTVTATSTVTSTVTATSTVTSTVTATKTQVTTVTQTATTVAPQVTTTSSSTLLAQGAQAPNFYIVNVQGQQTTTFYPGDVVMLRVAPFGTFAGKLAIYYIGPTGAQSQPLTYVYCGSNVLSTTQDIQVLPVTQQTLAGRYTLYVAVYDCANNPVRTVQLEFYLYTSQSANAPLPPAIDPTLVAVIIAVIAALAGVGLALARRRAPPSPPPQPQPQQPAPPPRPVAPAASQPGSTQVLSQVAARQPPSETKVGSPLAFLELPSGSSMPITESSAEFGRDDFKPYLPPETVQFISARHFRVYYAGGQWYIEDLGSTNGTLLNGQQIKGKGPLPLKPGDVISPAGVIKLVFKPG